MEGIQFSRILNEPDFVTTNESPDKITCNNKQYKTIRTQGNLQ